MFERVTPRDVVALVLIVGILALVALGRDSILYPMLTLITGYYFGKRI